MPLCFTGILSQMDYGYNLIYRLMNKRNIFTTIVLKTAVKLLFIQSFFLVACNSDEIENTKETSKEISRVLFESNGNFKIATDILDGHSQKTYNSSSWLNKMEKGQWIADLITSKTNIDDLKGLYYFKVYINYLHYSNPYYYENWSEYTNEYFYSMRLCKEANCISYMFYYDGQASSTLKELIQELRDEIVNPNSISGFNMTFSYKITVSNSQF